MSPPLHRLIYASRIAPSCQDDLKSALVDIVTRAIAPNRAARISSLLVAHRGWFVQALEGPRPTVETLFETIAADPRHHHALPLAAADADARLFEPWSMGARMLSLGDEAVLAALNPKAPFEPARLPERTVLRLLTTVADVHWRMLGEQQRRQDDTKRAGRLQVDYQLEARCLLKGQIGDFGTLQDPAGIAGDRPLDVSFIGMIGE